MSRGNTNRLARRALVVISLMNTPFLRAETPLPAMPKFEVASIKPCGGSGPRNESMMARHGRLLITCMPVRTLIRDAYLLKPDLNSRTVFGFDPITGGPDWAKSEGYTIEAKVDGNPTIQLMEGPMLQALLEDRFKLKVHRETKEIPVYELIVSKGGFKGQLLGANCIPQLYDDTKPPPDATVPPANPADQFKMCVMGIWTRKPGPGGPLTGNWATETHGTLDYFAQRLGQVMDRPVVNKTGLKGAFVFKVEFAPDGSTPAFLRGGSQRNTLLDSPPLPDEVTALPNDPGGSSIFTAVQEQLGLKLEPTKGPGTFIVIDYVERPSEN